MNYFTGTISHGSTGLKTISVGFQPVKLQITVSSKAGADSMNHRSVGWTDGTNSIYHSTYTDGSGSQTVSGTGKLVSHFERVGGVLTEKTQATFHSFTATQVKYNVNTADANYQYSIEVWG